jgi:hypothetical protein
MKYEKKINAMVQREWLGDELNEDEYLSDSIEANPHSASTQSWGVAESYTLNYDCIKIAKADEIRTYDPMTDPEVFTSFLRLGKTESAQSRGAKQRALKWVEKYGLLENGKTNITLPRKGQFDESVKVNQLPASASELIMEAIEIRQVASLYEDLRTGNFKKLIEQGISFKSVKKERRLTAVEAYLENHWANQQVASFERAARSFVPWLTARFLRDFLADKLYDVRITVSWGCLLQQPDNPFSSHLRPSSGLSYMWRDLRSAIYLQLALVMGGGEKMKWCENPNCRTPFPATRKDHRFCKDGCRSSARN